MKRRVAVSAGWIALIWLAGMVVAARSPALAQDAAGSAPVAKDKAAEPGAAASSEKGDQTPGTAPAGKRTRKASGAKDTAKASGRLPNYYARVVDKEQRAKILAIQDEYAAKIEAIQRQLKALTKERDEKMAAVLTPEQQKKVEEMKAAAQAARDAKKSAKDKSADK